MTDEMNYVKTLIACAVTHSTNPDSAMKYAQAALNAANALAVLVDVEAKLNAQATPADPLDRMSRNVEGTHKE